MGYQEDTDYEGENCTCEMITINGERFYLTVGTTFISATVPREDSPQQSDLRKVINILCHKASKIMLANSTKRRT